MQHADHELYIPRQAENTDLQKADKSDDSPRKLGLVEGGRRSQQTVLPGICREQKTTCSEVVLLGQSFRRSRELSEERRFERF